jgi:type IV secretory pathway VirD2 relaxase
MRSALLAALRRDGHGRARAEGRSGATARRPAFDPGMRRVIVKAHVHRLRAAGAQAAAAHLRYIERDGVEKDGSKGLLYGPEGPVRRETFEQPRSGEQHQFRLIVSPEDGDALDLTRYVRRLMAQVERDVGRKVEWAAVNHHDTDNPHAHIVVRGVTRDGEELRLDRSYIAKGMRWRAQEIATEELGRRHAFEVQRGYTREVTQERLTSLDREIARQAVHGSVEPRSRSGRVMEIDRGVLVARLEQLERMGLAAPVSSARWSLAADWQETLRERGARRDVLLQMHRAMSGDPARYHVVKPGQELPKEAWEGRDRDRGVVGRVAAKGLSDELRGVFYAVIETANGAGYHVALDARMLPSIGNRGKRSSPARERCPSGLRA